MELERKWFHQVYAVQTFRVIIVNNILEFTLPSVKETALLNFWQGFQMGDCK